MHTASTQKNHSASKELSSLFLFFFHFFAFHVTMLGMYTYWLLTSAWMDSNRHNPLQSSSCLLWTKTTYKRHRCIHCSNPNRNKRQKRKRNQSVVPTPHRAWIAWMHLWHYGDHWSGRVKKYFDMAFLNLFLYWSGDMIVGRTSLEPPKKPDAFTQVSSCLSQVYCRR